MPNSKNPFKDEQMKKYFSSLPASVQENMMQCNPGLKSLDELRQCADALTSHNKTSEE